MGISDLKGLNKQKVKQVELAYRMKMYLQMNNQKPNYLAEKSQVELSEIKKALAEEWISESNSDRICKTMGFPVSTLTFPPFDSPSFEPLLILFPYVAAKEGTKNFERIVKKMFDLFTEIWDGAELRRNMTWLLYLQEHPEIDKEIFSEKFYKPSRIKAPVLSKRKDLFPSFQHLTGRISKKKAAGLEEIIEKSREK